MAVEPIPAHLDVLLREIEQEVNEDVVGAWVGYTHARDSAVFVLFPTQCRIAWSRKGQQIWRRDEALITASREGRANVVLIEPSSGKSARFFVSGYEALDEISTALGGPTPGPLPTILEAVGSDRVVTLSELPGHRIERVHGVVSGIASLSGWTAASKGRGALDMAFPELLNSAARQGANAVVGLQATTFAAAGGITNMLGGDAVGVLLIGTAVTVIPEAEPEEPAAT